MATNFSVSDTAVQSYVADGGINVTRYRQNASGVLQAVMAAGGKVYPNLAPVPTRIPVFRGQTPIQGKTESLVGGSVSKQDSARAASGTNLLVSAHGEVEKLTQEELMAGLTGAGSAQTYAAQLVASKSPAIYAGFDMDHLAAIATGRTDVEWDAAAPIATLKTALAAYNETDYGPDAMIVTRRGALEMGMSVDGDGRLQFANGVRGLPVNMPTFETEVKSADIGVANLLAVIGPFGSCAVGMAGATTIKTFDQLEPTNGGAQENIISFDVNRYLGFARPGVETIPLAAWTFIIDAV